MPGLPRGEAKVSGGALLRRGAAVEPISPTRLRCRVSWRAPGGSATEERRQHHPGGGSPPGCSGKR
ncbi:vegetative cell wall protein gp1-like [Iris pallida]|uniref:Vegetative cell wall protein gp1-like n=1 Tax=Iris pallida TaxID=29817 RepID=A0AAX6FGX2_IRIPA|nr:vegetative cell wall protein gp1-like [Iris pallida]KAJ6815231.1 vegetative cell wall protein gp1-like [Iris pallida]